MTTTQVAPKGANAEAKNTSKSLASKAIDIKGKQYVQVADRLIFFNETYPKGSITTELISSPESKNIIIKATVKPDMDSAQAFTGYAQEVVGDGYINKTAALENAETSAVGRALAMMGIGVIDSVASSDEVQKSVSAAKRQANPVLAQKKTILTLVKQLGGKTTRETIAGEVKGMTTLELTEKNFAEIISRLEVLVAEQHND